LQACRLDKTFQSAKFKQQHRERYKKRIVCRLPESIPSAGQMAKCHGGIVAAKKVPFGISLIIRINTMNSDRQRI
jgi:hypothetical protein